MPGKQIVLLFFVKSDIKEMMILEPSLSFSSEEFQENHQAMQARMSEFKKRMEFVVSAGYQRAGKKLSVRKRIELLKDTGTEFLELSPLAADKVYGESSPQGAGLVTGVAQISGRECVVVANNSFVKGGAYYPLTVKKHLRAQEIALENHLPCIYLVDSGGAFLPLQAEVFPDKDHFGRIFYNQAQLSSKGLSQISVVLGSCTAGGAYVPAMSDENIIVQNQGTVFLGGPPLVEAATGEKVSAEELGGGDLHCKTSGVCDHLALTEEEALNKARQIVSRLADLQIKSFQRRESQDPLYPLEKLYGMIPSDLKKPLDMRNILAFLLDGSEFEEFKPEYGKSLLTGWAYVCGSLVGILANNGILFSESALKGAHFIDLCDQRAIPLLFFQNITGFMVGKQYEAKGIAKDGAKMVTAVSLARVPKLTVIVGGSFGAGNYGLCGRAYQGRFLWTWPSSRISVMGGEQAASVLWSLKKDAGYKEEEIKKPILEKYERESNPYFGTARLWDDGLIDPLDTRKVLAMALSLAAQAPLLEKRKGLYRM